MADSTLAGTITAIASIITALALLTGAIPLLLKALRDVKSVHVIVNQQRTDMQRYQRTLIRLLELHDIDVPPDQSNALDE